LTPVEAGDMIRVDHLWLISNQFLDRLDTNLQKAMA